jgi:hypothetical protein
VLPRDGGVLDQDPVLVKVLLAGLQAIVEVEKDEMDQEQKKAKRGGK